MSNKNDWHEMIGSTNEKSHPSLLLIKINQQDTFNPVTTLAVSPQTLHRYRCCPAATGTRNASPGRCWRPQEWILKVGLQSLKTIHRTGVHRNEHQVGLESARLQSICTGVHSRTRQRSAMVVLTMNYANYRSDCD
jgi:hypothetical protein